MFIETEEGTLGSLEVKEINMKFMPSCIQSLSTYVFLVVKNGKGSAVKLTAEVQAPQVYMDIILSVITLSLQL